MTLRMGGLTGRAGLRMLCNYLSDGHTFLNILRNIMWINISIIHMLKSFRTCKIMYGIESFRIYSFKYNKTGENAEAGESWRIFPSTRCKFFCFVFPNQPRSCQHLCVLCFSKIMVNQPGQLCGQHRSQGQRLLRQVQPHLQISPGLRLCRYKRLPPGCGCKMASALEQLLLDFTEFKLLLNWRIAPLIYLSTQSW